ncbi:hypothetical protein N806_29735 [Rhodococcus sp. P27]|nr:hypothetical protein N806_29735 [Rhodococcus sp. P27]
MINRGFTPAQRAELESIVKAAVREAIQPSLPPSDGVKRINFSGSLDSRELVGNIVDGIVHETATWPLRIIKKIFG